MGILPSLRIRACAAWPSLLDFRRWQWGGAKSWTGARLLGSWLFPGWIWSTRSAPLPPQMWQILPSRAKTSLRSAGQSTGSCSRRFDPTHPPDFRWGIVARHSLNVEEQEHLDLCWIHLGAEPLGSGPLKFCVAQTKMSLDVHDVIARIMDRHPGRRRVILCLHSGGVEPTQLEMEQRCSASVVAPLVGFLGRYAI